MTMNLIGKSKKSEFVWYTLHNDKVYFKIKSKSYDIMFEAPFLSILNEIRSFEIYEPLKFWQLL